MKGWFQNLADRRKTMTGWNRLTLCGSQNRHLRHEISTDPGGYWEWNTWGLKDLASYFLFFSFIAYAFSIRLYIFVKLGYYKF